MSLTKNSAACGAVAAYARDPQRPGLVERLLMPWNGREEEVPMQTGESFMNQHVNRRAVVSAASAIVAAAATTADAETVADIHWNGIASDGDILCLFEEWRSAYEAATDAGDDEPRTLIG